MNEYLVRTANPEAYEGAGSPVRQATRTAMSGSDWVLTILDEGNPTLPGDTLIGGWNYAGEQVETLDQAEFTAIRPLGNNPDGSATGQLLFHHYMGWAPRQLGSAGSLYPDDEQPFEIEVRHREFTGEVNPTWNGWGWRAEIIGGASSRDPSARAIGIYSDATCTAYLYTTGAFVQGPSEWQVDGAGDPLTVWFTQYNPAHLGYPNDEPQDVHHAVLKGSAQEGYATLQAGSQSALHQFWEHPQGYVPPIGAEWTDTGATITGQAGQLYYLSIPSATIGLIAGETIRLGAEEVKYVQTWAGTDNLIQIDPYKTISVGTKLYIYR